ncbi:MAG: hypothetical protein LLG42_12100 [Chloroflexi bacterium]|nr:hypothetical protein [Chloroflexota bacterium]
MNDQPEMIQKNGLHKKKHTSTILLIALLLGVIMPFGVYFSLQNGRDVMAAVCFGLLAFAMGLIAWKG